MKGWVLPVLLVFGGFMAYMVWESMQDKKFRAEVCVVFNGQRQCSTAIGSSETEATETAHRTACSIVAQGMTQLLACEKTAPVSEATQPVR
jgi:hypothetical protein